MASKSQLGGYESRGEAIMVEMNSRETLGFIHRHKRSHRLYCSSDLIANCYVLAHIAPRPLSVPAVTACMQVAKDHKLLDFSPFLSCRSI